ncbi:MAG: hypothetical protein OXC64_06370 [Flavobacteriaceae bacterium]|nr:hypothetical protein [Flavobacteriaceae bacterium]
MRGETMDGVRPWHLNAFDFARRTTNTRNTTVNRALASKHISMTPNTLFPMVIKNSLLTGFRASIRCADIRKRQVNNISFLIIVDQLNLPIRAQVKFRFSKDG